MSNEGNDMPDDEVQEMPLPPRTAQRIDAVSAVAGLLFIAVAVLALADRFWAEIDAVLVVGGAIIAIGVAMIAGVIVRRRPGERERST